MAAVFQCSRCGCNESVCIRTTGTDGKILRRRRCMKCGHVMETEETISDANPKQPGKPRGAAAKAMKNAK